MNKREINVPPLWCGLDIKYSVIAMLNTKKYSTPGVE
jgi:hypothetical protein